MLLETEDTLNPKPKVHVHSVLNKYFFITITRILSCLRLFPNRVVPTIFALKKLQSS